MLYQWDDDALQYVQVMLVVIGMMLIGQSWKTDTKNEAEGRGQYFRGKDRGVHGGTSLVRALEGASFLTRDHHKTTNIGLQRSESWIMERCKC